MSDNIHLKPGVKTSEFWTLIALNVILFLSSLTGKLDGELVVLISAGLTALYNYVRAGFKLSAGLRLRDGVQTSEFWAMASAGAMDLILGALDKCDGPWAVLATTALGAVYKISRLALTGMEIKKAKP